jgi:outer membrane immunogenic protein
LAADLPIKAPVVKAPAIYSWTGCYAGLHSGSTFVQKDWGASGSDDDSGLILGGQLGCNYQVSNWVFGAQGDLAWSNASGTHPDQLSAGLTDQWKVDSIGSVTGRFGYAFDQLLVYGKGGGAWAHNKYDAFVTTTGAQVSAASETRSGWTVGAGFEHSITDRFTMFVEYDFYDFGTRNVGFSGGFQPVDIRDRESVVKVGANYKIGW